MADPEQIYSEVLTEEQGKGVSPAVAEGRAKAARARAEHGSPHPKEPKWWPGAQPHLEGGDGAAPEAEAAEAEAPEEPAAEVETPTEDAATDQQPAEAPTAPEAPAATEEQQAPQVPQEQASPPEPAQPAAATAPQAAQAKPSGVTHGTTTGTRLRPEDEVTTEAQFQGQQAMYDRRKLIDELIATGVPATAAAEAGEKRSPMLFFLYLLIPLAAIGIVLSLSDGGGAVAEDGGHGNGGDAAVTISASNVQFDVSELTFPADEATTLTFNNEDSVEHNVSIYETEDAEAEIFTGQNVGAGASTDYEIPATPKGEYFFRCDLHPSSMVGTAIFE